MADGSVTIDTSLDNDGLKKGIGNIENSFDKLKNVAIKSIGAIGFGSLVKEGVEYNATVEQLQTSFEVMTGSATKATNIVEKLKEIGAKTPFEFTGLAETTQLLMNYGLEADDAIDKMQMLGDISQGSADKMNRIAMAYGQMSSSGKVALEDVKQMIEAGFNPLQEISQTTGESMASLYDRISKGTISIDEITASMERSTSAGGKYFQSMDKQSATFNGQLSTLKDSFSNLLGSILKPLSELLSNTILPAVNDFMGKLQEKIENGSFDDFLQTLKSMLAVIVPLTTGFITFKASLAISNLISDLKKGFDALKISFATLNAVMSANPILLIVSLIAALVSAIIYLWNTNEDFRNAIMTAWEAVKNAISTVVNAIVTFFTETIPNAWNNFVAGLQNIVQTIWDTLVNAWNSIVSFFTETIPSWIQSVIQWFKDLPYNLGLIVGEMIGHIIKFGQDAWNWVTTELPKIIQGVIDWFAELPGNIWNWLVQTATNIYNWGMDIRQKAIDTAQSFFNNIKEWFSKLPGEIWNWLVKTANDIYNWGQNIVNTARNAVSNLVNTVINTIKSLPSKIIEVGKNIVEGLWNGIQSMIGWIKDKISGFLSGIVDGVKGVLGIHSPSKVFNREVGRYMALGISEGFNDNLDTVYRDMEKAINYENDKLTSNLTNTQQIKTQIEDDRQIRLQSIDDNKDITVNTVTNLDSKVLTTATNKVNTRRKLQYGY